MTQAEPPPLVHLLRKAAPGHSVEERIDPWHGEHARAYLTDARCVQFVYLFERDDATCLALYPADTLGQARVFYGDDARVRNVLRLTDHGWDVMPNFHFGFMEKGLTWATAEPPLRDYTDYWRGRISSLGKLGRDDWPRELDRLVHAKIFNSNDLEQFRRDFTETGRREASPRPGLRLIRRWPNSEATDPSPPTSIREAVVQALSALGEHQSLTRRR